MEKLTDNEIIKALPTVAYGGHSCNKCRYKWDNGENRCGLKGCRITRNALDLINRQKAEIRRLNQGAIKEQLRRQMYRSTVDEIKSEAIKEFAERLTNRICEKLDRSLGNHNGNNYFITDVYEDIDELVKEMAGD